ncbi:hypothetical protein HALLA_16055 [Halostagnicola larsenii XH-48]|uniref:DUF8009 domain-containing protein n=1 Tax=Halostagnicola larsenii XH-48 TaxID=797299 RepID=W0JNB2_9EURY|nr:hypothetical protein [Halostagnicola larsenii]AHG00089.1 hypothetical protein HALLA_16055 [Halostagnicola larsenii XH-48]
MSDSDPSSIRSLAVATEDVVDAAIYGRENPGTAVLRVTPPFHGRMRARLHVYHDEDGRVSEAIHLEPDDLLADEVLEAYPSFDERSGDDQTGDPDRIRDRRERALEAWREQASEAILEAVTLEQVDGDDGGHRVDVKRLG